MGSRNRAPLAPDFNRSPSLLAGMNSRPEYRGKTAAELNATVPVFSSWEQAIASPYFAGMDDRMKTMWLRELYGMGHDLKVERGRLVSDNNSTRNGILGGIGVIGGLSGLDAVIGGGTAGAATAGGTLPATTIPAATGTLTTGAVAPAMTTGAAAVGGAAVPGATGAITGGGGSPSGGVGGDLLNQIRNGNGAAAVTALLPLLAAATRGGGGGNQVAYPAGLESMLNMSVERAKRTDPLHQSITQLAMSRLPTNMQR
ncbi:MAG: hypothetical protein AB7P99_10160 [Vicinamibacterales bacterium]